MSRSHRLPRGFKADQGMGYAEIEARCARLREYLVPGIGPLDRVPALKVFDSLDERVAALGDGVIRLDHGVAELAAGVEGHTRFDEKSGRIVVELSPATDGALERDDPRARNTVCHEVSHAFLHTRQLVRLTQIPHHEIALQRATRPTHRHFEDTEWQANAGAAALMMPAEGIALIEKQKGYLSSRDLQNTFGASHEAANYRLQNFQERRRELLR